MNRRQLRMAWLATAVVLAGPVASAAQMSEAEEARLALSAGPPAVHAEAGVYVLREAGYERVRESRNGFNCFVERVPNDPSVRAPQCMDALASAHVLPVKLEEARLRRIGWSEDRVEAEIARGFGEGRFRPPPEPAFTYMLSSGQYLGEAAGQWKPHVMIYTPYRTNEELGGSPERPEYPFIAFEEGRPLSLTVIVTTAWVDPEAVSMGR